ncbi:hypothetical protein [Patulibacter minatonensis]|uniref:hypothetical protein n=1 Tax=Patulibacter minatonensis TaxID=298163 RepID=UPI00055D78BD|nr:hypothetical protein [Patulibacter minatonensis]
MPADLAALWRRAQRGWPASYPVVQFPNAPLLVAIGASLFAKAASGDASDLLAAVSRVGVTIWAYLELAHGDDAFRRVLGAGGLVYVAVAISGVTD